MNCRIVDYSRDVSVRIKKTSSFYEQASNDCRATSNAMDHFVIQGTHDSKGRVCKKTCNVQCGQWAMDNGHKFDADACYRSIDSLTQSNYRK